ncbi:hypothetical protein MKQ70_32025 [Chitinophaga sedimenti]|nr:hypothetical protein [Chitinophaga sedimenti]
MKLADHTRFANTIAYQKNIATFSEIIAWAIPLIELAIALLLFIPRFRRVGLLAGGALMSFFTIYVGVSLLSGEELPCSCGGVISQMNWTEHFFFNLFFSVSAILSWFMLRNVNHGKSKYKLSNPLPR